MTENEIGNILLRTAISVHRRIGPGLYESVYETILTYRLNQLGLKTERQVKVSLEIDGFFFEEGFRADLIIEGKVVVEIKSVERIVDTHRKQLLTYLKLTGIHLGFLLNFNESLLKNGIHRVVNRLRE